MIRQISILTLLTVLVGGMQPGHAQPRSSTPTSQAVLDEVSELNKLVEKLYGEGKFAEAVPLAERALALRDKALGPMHPDVADSLNNLAGLYQDQGAYPKAEPLYVRALGIREKALGPMHPDVASSLNNFARLYQAQGAYPKAEPLLSRAAEIRESQLRSSLAPSRNRASEQ
jgi:tetratricopeptide (TPR) repeat protein